MNERHVEYIVYRRKIIESLCGNLNVMYSLQPTDPLSGWPSWLKVYLTIKAALLGEQSMSDAAIAVAPFEPNPVWFRGYLGF